MPYRRERVEEREETTGDAKLSTAKFLIVYIKEFFFKELNNSRKHNPKDLVNFQLFIYNDITFVKYCIFCTYDIYVHIIYVHYIRVSKIRYYNPGYLPVFIEIKLFH